MARKKHSPETPVGTSQTKLIFFGHNTDDGTGKPIKPPSPEEIRKYLDRTNPHSPFHDYIGNDSAIDDLTDILFDAHTRDDHNAGPNGVALIGPASTGKTTLARKMGMSLGTSLLANGKIRINNFPFVECDRNIGSTALLLEKMRDSFIEAGCPLVPQAGGGGVQQYKCPPCIIYFDEAHAIRGDWLLKATERKDTTLITSNAVCDCRNVFWVLGTTHRGKLPKAFDSRFNKVFLESYTLDQVAKMVRNSYPNFPEQVCKMVAGYGARIPREALDFANKVKLASQRLGIADFSKVCKIIGERGQIDEEGLNRQHLAVLAALYNNKDRSGRRVSMSLKQLANQVSMEECDLEEFVLPRLAFSTMDCQPKIRTSSGGRELTEAGVECLMKRGIIVKKS